MHAHEMHAYEVPVYETHAYQMHDRLTVPNRPRLINTLSLGQKPYLHSLGIGGGEVDGTAVMEGGQATVVCLI